jgi:hypothetical protein
MAKKAESGTMKDIQIALSGDEVRLWRNNVGEGWQGHARRTPVGRLIVENPRRLLFGLCPGSSDLIGFRSLKITPEMVGKRVAVFTAIEVKANQYSPFRDGQEEFLAMVGAMGGIAGAAYSILTAAAILEAYDYL